MDGTQGTTATPYNWNYNENYCLQRLPCGYCKALDRPCPMLSQFPSITWTAAGPEPTCKNGSEP